MSMLDDAVRAEEGARLGCPFLRAPVEDTTGVCPDHFVCTHRRGPLRAPSGDELAWFCLTE